jgi:hypothetical protein
MMEVKIQIHRPMVDLLLDGLKFVYVVDVVQFSCICIPSHTLPVAGRVKIEHCRHAEE